MFQKGVESNNRIANSCILLHGAWHGGWVWKPVIKQIQQAAGYKKIIAPDLPGHGDNKADFKNITLESYTSYIINLIKSMPKPVALVGHSMAGMVISQIAEQVPEDIAYLIYLSGFIPDNGGSLIDEEKKAAKPSVALAVTVDQTNSMIKIDHMKLPHLFYNCSGKEHINFAFTKLQDQPLLPFMSPVSISEAKFGKVDKFYIKCLKDNAIHPIDQERMYSKINCRVLTLDTDHSPFFSAPEELATIIGLCADSKAFK